jgi:hypothetical protein
MDSAIVFALLFAVASFTVMYAAMMFKRIELARFDDEVLVAEQTASGPVAGEAVTAPDLTKGS